MRRFKASITLRPLGLVDRLWYWRCGMTPPRAEGLSREIKSLRWARLVPMCFREFHRAYAGTHGLCWLPCPLCMTAYGGHQSSGGVPDPTQPPAGPFSPLFYVGICPTCTRRRKDV